MINPVKADKLISGILESPNETRTVEFKPSFQWPNNIKGLQNNPKAQETIKSILALSNTSDGGKIILGIEKDNSKERYILKGMKRTDLGTFDHDLIFDHVRNFGRPEPRFQVLNTQFSTKNFIVFSVQSFTFSPIVCRNYKNLEKLEDAAIYIRTHKPETKKVTEPSQMKELIDLTVGKEIDLLAPRIKGIIKAIAQMGVSEAPKQDEDKFLEELKDILNL